MLRIWDQVELFVVGTIGAITLSLSLYEMIVRYFVPSIAPDWTSELVVYLVIWAVFISTSLLAGRNRHVRVDLFIRLFSPNVQRMLEIFNSAAALLFCVLLVWFGWQAVELGQLLDERSASSMRFPMWLYYLALPVGAALMSLRFAYRLYQFLFAFDAATMTVSDPDLSQH